MFDDPQKAISLFAAVATFGLILSVWMMGVLIWTSRRKRRNEQVQQRLNMIQGSAGAAARELRLWHDGKEATTVVPSLVRGGLKATVERIRVEAGWESPPSTIAAGLCALLLLVGLSTYLLTGSVVVGILAVLGALVLFWIHVTQRIAKRTATFERQLIDALELAARSLRIGHPLVGSFRLISEEIPEPVGTLFAGVCQHQALGAPLEDALRNAAEEHASEDLRLFATSVVIQLNSGGNLADMMERLAKVIRERQRLARRVKVLTAQTQFSKRVLLSLPFLVFVVLNVINPNYMRPLYTTFTGQIILLIAGLGLLLGWITMNWLSKLAF